MKVDGHVQSKQVRMRQDVISELAKHTVSIILLLDATTRALWPLTLPGKSLNSEPPPFMTQLNIFRHMDSCHNSRPRSRRLQSPQLNSTWTFPTQAAALCE